jgi:FkbM family methyltransferase
MIVDEIIRTSGDAIGAIVHIGAHIGQEFLAYGALQPKFVLLVEADPLTFQYLVNNVLSVVSRVNVVPFFANALLSDRDGEMTKFYTFSNNGASSSVFRATETLLETWKDLTETGQVLELPSLRLPTLLSNLRLGIPDDSVLVIDTQGSELVILRGAQELLHKFRYVEVEVSTAAIYEGAPLFPEVHLFLLENGFTLVTEVPWHGDVVYRRL